MYFSTVQDEPFLFDSVVKTSFFIPGVLKLKDIPTVLSLCS